MSGFLYICYRVGNPTPVAIQRSRKAAAQWLTENAAYRAHVVAVPNTRDAKETQAVNAEAEELRAIVRGCMTLYAATWSGRNVLGRAVDKLIQTPRWHKTKVVAHVRMPDDKAVVEACNAVFKPVLLFKDMDWNYIWSNKELHFMFLYCEADIVAAKLAGVEIFRYKVLP